MTEAKLSSCSPWCSSADSCCILLGGVFRTPGSETSNLCRSDNFTVVMPGHSRFLLLLHGNFDFVQCWEGWGEVVEAILLCGLS